MRKKFSQLLQERVGPVSLFSSSKLEDLIESYKVQTGKRLTIRELAKETSISPAYLTLLKNGQRTNPSMDVVLKLSAFFQVDPEELLEDEEAKRGEPKLSEHEPAAGDQARRMLELCEQLIAANSAQQALDLLAILDASGETYSREFRTEIQLARASALIALGRYEESLSLLDECLKDSLAPLLRAKALQICSRARYYSERYALAIENLLEAKGLAEGCGDRELLYRIHFALGLCYNQTHEYGSSLYHYECAARLFPENMPPIQKAHLLMGMGNTHLYLNSISASRLAYREAEEIYRNEGERKYLAGIQHNIARADFLEGKYESAIEGFKEALRMHQEAGEHLGIALDHLELAACYKELGKWERVEEHALRASITFENGNKRGMGARARLLMIEAMLQRKTPPANAVELINEVIDVFRDLNWHLLVARAYHVKAAWLKEQGREDEALALSLQALDLYGTYAEPTMMTE
jgi:tetratricopeptide (TPR) repeat protein